TLLSTLDHAEQTALAKLRQSQPLKLIGGIRGELDWIVMKALEKDRKRRYETAQGLASDVQRYLRHDPVLARPPGTLYRFRKVAQRHKLAFGITGVAILGLIIAVVELSYGFKLSQASKLSAVPISRIAVFPFSNASPVQVDSYLSESLTAELISTFGKVPGLR